MIPVKLVHSQTRKTKVFATQSDAADFLSKEAEDMGKSLKATSAIVSISNRIISKNTKPYWGYHVYPAE